MCLLPGVRTWCSVSSKLLVLEPLGLIRTTRFNTSSDGQSFRMSKDSFSRQLSPQCGSECRDIMCARRQEPCLPRCATLLAVHISDAFVGTYRPSESLPDSLAPKNRHRKETAFRRRRCARPTKQRSQYPPSRQYGIMYFTYSCCMNDSIAVRKAVSYSRDSVYRIRSKACLTAKALASMSLRTIPGDV